MGMKAKASAREEIASRKQLFVREEILASAAKLFAESGYRAVTIDDIAANLGYTKSVVYYYFKSKNEILWQIFSRMYESYFRAIEAIRSENLPPDQALAKMIRQHALEVMENRDWTAIYFREESELDAQQKRQIGRMKREYDAMFEAVFVSGVSLKLFRKMPPHIAISGLLGMCNWLFVWYNEKGALTAEEIADHYSTLLANGYRMEKP